MKTFEQLKQQAVAIRDAVNKNENSAERVGAHLLDTVEKMESLEITDVAEAVLEAEAAAAEAKKQADIASQSGEIAQKAKEQGDIAEQKGNEADAAAQRANEAADQVTNKVLFKIPQDLSEEEQAQVKRNIGLQNAIAGLITLPITDFSAKVNATTATKTVDNIIPSGISFLIVDIGVVEGDSSTPTSPELSAVLCPVSGGGRIVFQGTASTKFENFKISVISGSAEKNGMGVEVSTPRSITYKVFQVRYLTEADSASFKGSFNSSGILQSAYPTARPGDYAYVGNPRHLYEWDSSAWQDRGLYITDVDQALDIDSGKAIANKAVAVKLSELNNKLIPIEEVRLNGVYINPFEKSSGNGETLLIAKKFDRNYISSGATISPTTSSRAVAKYKVNSGETIHVIIPKNGNEYSITYAYFNDLDGTVGTKPSDGGIVGSETRFENDIVVENYPYIGFTYTTDDGEPVVTRDKKTEEYDYNGTIEELYISAIVPEGNILVLKQYGNNLYVRPATEEVTGTAQSWQSVTPLSDIINGEIVELKCTKAGDGVELDTIVGYVIFKDIDKFKGIEVAYVGLGVYPYVFNLSNFPRIADYLFFQNNKHKVNTEDIIDSAVTTDKIGNNSITKDKLSKDLSDKIFEKETLLIAKKFDRNYISSGATISPTTSSRAVAKYKVNSGETIHVIIPKNGNEYSITYAYFNDLDGTVGTKPSDGGIVGSETRFENDIVVENYPYIGFTYTTDDGEPVVTRDKKTLGQNDVERIVKEETSLVESKLYTNGVDIILPDKFIAVKNDNLQIFWKSIIKSVSPYSFGIISKCLIGKHYPRYYSLLASAATSSVGQEKELTVEVLDNNYNDIAVNKTIIKIIDVPVSPSENKNILCVGASATENGQWPNELRRRLTKSDGDGTSYNPRGLGLTNIEFVGRRKATVQNIQLEATGGWSVKEYSGAGRKAYRFFVTNVTQLYVGDKYAGGGATFTITEINVTEGSGNIRCTYDSSPSISESGSLNKSSGTGDSTITYTRYESESYNPFYNEDEERLDFKKYADKYCNGSIDLFLWHCGVNDIFSGTQESITNAIEAYRKILRAYHADFPNGKVIISSVPLGDPHGGFGANYGASLTSNYYIFARQVFEYTKQLILLCKEEEFSSYTYYCPVMEEFDSENSYPSEQASVNNRIKDVKEKVGTNGVHPTMEGYYMVADSFYRTVCLVLNEVDKK